MRRVSGRSRRPGRRFTAAATVFGLACCVCQLPVSRGFGAPPPRPLTAEKLQPLGTTGIWMCEDERQLRLDLASLPAHRQAIEELQKVLATIVTTNARRWAARQSAGGASNDAAVPAGTPRPEGRAGGRLAAGSAVDPARIGDVPLVRRTVIRLTNLRIQLAMTLSRIRRTSSRMATTYERLASDQAILDALARLGANQRLGPASDKDAELQRLRDYFPVAETPWVPAYLQGPYLRFTGVCNERAPATFTWSPDLAPVLVTTGSFQAAGLQLPEEARPIGFQYQGSTIDVYQIRLPYLQFGSCLLREVPAYLLPPESEYLGNRIGGPAFEGYQVLPDPRRLRVSFKPRD